MKATIKVVKMGVHFGLIGKVFVGRKVVAETRLVPYGMPHVARELATEEAKKLGLEVAATSGGES